MSEGPGSHGLSGRELEVMALIVEGFTNSEIGTELGISARTVQAHVAAARMKTGTRSRTQLAVYALRAGLIPLGPDRSDSS